MSVLPELPEGFFWRVDTRYFLGTTFVRVQIRRRWKVGPLRWSTREDVGMSTQEILGMNTDEQVARELARQQAKGLYARRRPVQLGTLEGDH